MSQITGILVPLDFSAHSSSALQYAVDLARQNSATLELAHVFDFGIHTLPDGELEVCIARQSTT